MELREATREAIDNLGIEILTSSKRFTSCVIDMIDNESKEARILVGGCDDVFISFFADAAEAGTAAAFRDAANRAADHLVAECMYNPPMAKGVADAIALGIGDALGLAVPDDNQPAEPFDGEPSMQETLLTAVPLDVNPVPVELSFAEPSETAPAPEAPQFDDDPYPMPADEAPADEPSAPEPKRNNKVLVGVGVLAAAGIALAAFLMTPKGTRGPADTQLSAATTEAHSNDSDDKQAPEEPALDEAAITAAVEDEVYHAQEELIDTEERAAVLATAGVDLSGIKDVAHAGLNITLTPADDAPAGDGAKAKADAATDGAMAYDVQVAYDGPDINQLLTDATKAFKKKSGGKKAAQKVVDAFVEDAQGAAPGESKQASAKEGTKETCNIVVEVTPASGDDEAPVCTIKQGKDLLFGAIASAMSLPLDPSRLSTSDVTKEPAKEPEAPVEQSEPDGGDQQTANEGQRPAPNSGSDDEDWEEEEDWDEDEDWEEDWDEDEDWYDEEEDWYDEDEYWYDDEYSDDEGYWEEEILEEDSWEDDEYWDDGSGYDYEYEDDTEL